MNQQQTKSSFVEICLFGIVSKEKVNDLQERLACVAESTSKKHDLITPFSCEEAKDGSSRKRKINFLWKLDKDTRISQVEYYGSIQGKHDAIVRSYSTSLVDKNNSREFLIELGLKNELPEKSDVCDRRGFRFELQDGIFVEIFQHYRKGKDIAEEGENHVFYIGKIEHHANIVPTEALIIDLSKKFSNFVTVSKEIPTTMKYLT